MSCISSLDQLVVCANRLGDILLIEEVSHAIWNESLFLLQPETRSVLLRAFKHCADALAENGSVYFSLRVKLHVELAFCELDSGFVSKARQELDHALSLDYTLPLEQATSSHPDTEKPEFFQRPYDRFMNTLMRRLLVRGDFIPVK